MVPRRIDEILRDIWREPPLFWDGVETYLTSMRQLAADIDTSDTRHGRDRWMKKTKEILDYAALAALLD